MRSKPEDMIPYIQSVGSQQVPPPYNFPGVTAHGFVWEAQMDAVQAYCDSNYNLGDDEDRGFIYRPAAVWPYVLLMCIDYPVMVSANAWARTERGRPRYADRGAVAQREVFVGIPLIRYGASGVDMIRNTTIEWALPFIVVENAMSAVCGREMVGLEKLLADIAFRENKFPNSFYGRIRLPGWETEGVEQEDALTFLEVKTGPTLPTFRGSDRTKSLWSLFQTRAAAEWFERLSSAADFVGSVSEDLVPTAMRTVALKQIRDAEKPEQALYQALVGCRSKYSNIKNFQFYNEKNVYLDFYGAASFNDLFAIFIPPETKIERRVPEGEGTMRDVFCIRPKAAFRFNADITFDDMRTVHTFKTDGDEGRPPRLVSDVTAPWLRPWRGLFTKDPS